MQIGMGVGLGFLNRIRLPTIPGLPDIATTPASTTTFAGEQFIWTGNTLPLAQYVMGEPFVLSDAAASVTQMGRASVDVNTYKAHGAMINPYIRITNRQGFAGVLGVNTQQSIPYFAADNVDPTAAGAPYALSVGAELTIVKAVQRAGAVAASWLNFDGFMPLTVVPVGKRPKVGDFRPPICTTDKTSRLNLNDLDLACCRNIDITGLGYPTYATLIARWRNVMPFLGVGGESLRVMQVLGHLSSDNYSATYAPGLIGDSLALINSNSVTGAEKIEIAKWIGQTGSDFAGQMEMGFVGGAGEGQHQFSYETMMAGAILFNSSYLRNAAQTLRSNIDQTYWGDTTNIGKFTYWPDTNQSGENEFVWPFTTQDTGKPIWGGRANGYPYKPSHGTQLDRLYLGYSGAGRARFDCLVPLMLLTANRSMPSGLDIIRNGGPDDNTNHRSSAPHFIDRERDVYRALGGGGPGTPGASDRAIALYDAARSLIPLTRKLFVPDTPYQHNFTAADNAINYDYSAMIAVNGYSSSAITSQNLYISQDNIQFKKITGVASSGSVAAPAGINHWASISFVNAQGEGRRTKNGKTFASDVTDKGLIVPTGVAIGTVTCTDLPQLMVREFPENTLAPWFVTPSGTVPAGTGLFVGSGFWSGAISGAPTLVVQRENTLNAEDWVTASGTLTGAFFEMAVADCNKRLRCSSTRNGVTAFSAAITVGVIPAIPAGTIVDTTFGPNFKVQYPAVWASFQAESTNVSSVPHEPERVWDVLDTSSGGVRGVKSASFPRLTALLTGLEIGQTYRCIIDCPIEADGNDWLIDGICRFGTTKFGSQYFSVALPRNATAGAQPSLVVVDRTFVATQTTVYAEVTVPSSSGAVQNPAMSRLSVIKQ